MTTATAAAIGVRLVISDTARAGTNSRDGAEQTQRDVLRFPGHGSTRLAANRCRHDDANAEDDRTAEYRRCDILFLEDLNIQFSRREKVE